MPAWTYETMCNLVMAWGVGFLWQHDAHGEAIGLTVFFALNEADRIRRRIK